MAVAHESKLTPQATSRGPVDGAPRVRATRCSRRCTSELHRLARREAARAGPGAVLSATTLIHEVYLDMSQRDALAFPDRGHFLAYAARAMRAVAIDRARANGALKRGGGLDITSLDTETAESVAEPARSPRSARRSTSSPMLEPGARQRRRPEVLLRLLVRRDRGAAGRVGAHRAAPLGEGAPAALSRRSDSRAAAPHRDRRRRRALEAAQPAARRPARPRAADARAERLATLRLRRSRLSPTSCRR